MRGTDKALAKHLMREAGIPTPDFYALRQPAIRDLGAGAAVPSIEERLGFPLVVKPSRGGLGDRRQVRELQLGAAGRDGRRLLL